MAQKQPFLISVLPGYHKDLKPAELEEVMRLLFLIWEYFKDLPGVGKTQISTDLYERIELKNMQMLKYSEGEQSDDQKTEIFGSDLKHLKSQALFTGVLLQANHKKALVEMDPTDKSILVLGMKCLIECFEEICEVRNMG